MDVYRPQAQVTALGTRVELRAVMKEVYLWMTLGLITTTVIALLFAVTGLTEAIFPVLIVAPIVQIGLVWYLSARVFKMEAQRATNMFLLFAAVMGISMSTIFYWANLADIYLALFATAGMFGAMSIIGYTTQIDLTRMGSYLFMALIGLIIASIVNLFLASETLYWLVTYAGVIIFVGLTAYDTQWIQCAAAGDSGCGQWSRHRAPDCYSGRAAPVPGFYQPVSFHPAHRQPGSVISTVH
jgi:FtsH-binding integral membrane protein